MIDPEAIDRIEFFGSYRLEGQAVDEFLVKIFLKDQVIRERVEGKWVVSYVPLDLYEVVYWTDVHVPHRGRAVVTNVFWSGERAGYVSLEYHLESFDNAERVYVEVDREIVQG